MEGAEAASKHGQRRRQRERSRHERLGQTRASPRQDQWRLPAAHARSDRLTLGGLGALHRTCDPCRAQFAATGIPIRHYCILRKEQRAATARCVAFRKRARRRLRTAPGANAIVRPAPNRDDRRDSDVAKAQANLRNSENMNAIVPARGAGAPDCPQEAPPAPGQLFGNDP